jgi:hypothetical protein
MDHALMAALNGVLDVSDVLAIADTLPGRAPVFVMAARELIVQTNRSLQRVGTGDSYTLWKVTGSDRN